MSKKDQCHAVIKCTAGHAYDCSGFCFLVNNIIVLCRFIMLWLYCLMSSLGWDAYFIFWSSWTSQLIICSRSSCLRFADAAAVIFCHTIQYVVSLVPSLQWKMEQLGITVLINDKNRLKRDVKQIGFQFILKTSKSLSRSDRLSRLFHTVGPGTEKVRSPNLVFCPWNSEI